MVWWLWVVLGFVLLAVETLHMGLFLIFFGIGAVLVGMLTRMGWAGPEWAQWLLFSAISGISLALFRKPLVQALKLNERKAVDTMAGEVGKAMEAIAVNARGKAELRGTHWTALNIGARPLAAGESFTVESVDGITLKVRAE